MHQIIEIKQGDITLEPVDAIVNAANTELRGGGGVDGAIHRKAGPELLEECKKIGHCPVGEARLTRGYLLPAKWVIHTVGPLWKGGTQQEALLLARCYQNTLQLAHTHGIRSLAFPSISTGVYQYPIEKACRIALKEILNHVQANPQAFKKIICVCFDQKTLEHYRAAYKGFSSPET